MVPAARTQLFSPLTRENGVLVTRKVSGRSVGELKKSCASRVLVMRETYKRWRTLHDVWFFLHVPPEIIEDTNEVAIKISGHKLA